MTVEFHRTFKKKLAGLPAPIRQRFYNRLALFLINPNDRQLYNHPLRGQYEGYHSISVGGDLRVIYKAVAEDTCIFVTIDTHSNLYR